MNPVAAEHALARLSAVGFGGAPIGNLYAAVSDHDASRAIATAWSHGIRYFDTAPHYGLGLSERRLGRALANYPRNDFLLSTKVGRRLVARTATGSDLPNAFDVPDDHTRTWDFSSVGVQSALDDSLARLGVERVDIAYIHDPDDHLEQALNEALPALASLRAQGTIAAVGVAMNRADLLRPFVRSGLVDVVMVAGRWTLMDRTAARLIEECAHNGVVVVAAAPFNSGLLANSRVEGQSLFDYAPASSEVLRRARELATVCQRYGVTLPAAAMQFPFRSPIVRTVVVGMRSSNEAMANMVSFATPIPPELWIAIDDCVAEWDGSALLNPSRNPAWESE